MLDNPQVQAYLPFRGKRALKILYFTAFTRANLWLNGKPRTSRSPMHVLYSFPYWLGKTGIGMIAWQHINWLSGFGTSVTVFCASIEKALPSHVDVKENIGTGIFQIPLRVLGPMMGPRLHDLQVSLYLRTTRKRIDVFHGWPLGSEKSLAAASSKGILTILENCNSHIERLEGLLRKEYSSLGMSRTHPVVGNRNWINRHKREYELADFLACPSDFVRGSFLERAFPSAKLLQTQYGFDESVITCGEQETISNFRAIFIAHGEPRKGLHYLLAAWNKANLPNGSQLSIVGLMEPAYTVRCGICSTNKSRLREVSWICKESGAIAQDLPRSCFTIC